MPTTNYPALQTHGLTVWAPPLAGRFVSYDERDREWMEPLGIGRQVKAPLYDVRAQDGELIGYTDHDPRGCGDRSCIEVAHMPPVDYFPRRGAGFSPRQLTTIRIDVRLFDVVGEIFVTWQCHRLQAVKLIQARWIKAIGEERIHEFAERIRYEHFRRDFPLRTMQDLCAGLMVPQSILLGST